MATATASQSSSPERVGFLQLILRNQPYRALFLSQVTGQTGDWLNLLAVFQLATRTSDPGIVVALVLAIHYASAFVLGPLAGILADRLNRRSLLVALDLIRVPLVLGFLLIDTSSVALLGLATAQY